MSSFPISLRFAKIRNHGNSLWSHRNFDIRTPKNVQVSGELVPLHWRFARRAIFQPTLQTSCRNGLAIRAAQCKGGLKIKQLIFDNQETVEEQKGNNRNLLFRNSKSTSQNWFPPRFQIVEIVTILDGE
jgi:hypothetical protein